MDFVYSAETTYHEEHNTLQCDDGDLSPSLSQASDETPALSVRDMIRRYDSAIKRGSEPQRNSSTMGSQHSLATALKTANGMIKGNGPQVQPTVKNFVSKVNETDKIEKLNKDMRSNIAKRLNQINSECCGATNVVNTNLHGSSMVGCNTNYLTYVNHSNQTQTQFPQRRLSNHSLNVTKNTSCDTALNRGSPEKNMNYHTKEPNKDPDPTLDEPTFGDPTEEMDEMPPMQTSYQSRTTIARSDVGVRITIDIFFDQDNPGVVNPNDVIGSRIETELPRSRILSEFQDQTAAAAQNCSHI